MQCPVHVDKLCDMGILRLPPSRRLPATVQSGRKVPLGASDTWVVPMSWNIENVSETLAYVESFLAHPPGDYQPFSPSTVENLQRIYAKLCERHAQLEYAANQRSVATAAAECKTCEGLRSQLSSMQEQLASAQEGCRHQLNFLQLATQEKERLMQESAASVREAAHFKVKCGQIETELARMVERCDQQQKALEASSAENIRLRGELSDLTSKLISWPTVHEAAPAEDYSDNFEQMPASSKGSWVFTGANDGSNSGSSEWHHVCSYVSSDDAASQISVCTQNCHCFTHDAIFKTMSGESVFFLPAAHLQKGSRVVADNGQRTEVACTPEGHETDTVIDLHAGAAVLSVTTDHRIPIVRSSTGERCEVRAADLKLGDDRVFVDGNPTELSSVQRKTFAEKVKVIKISFKPDLPIGVFSCPPSISSLGHRKKPLRRSRMNKRGQNGANIDACSQLLETAPGEYQD